MEENTTGAPESMEDECAKIWLEDGIIHFCYKRGAIVDLKVQQQHIVYRQKVGGGRVRPLFSDARDAQYWTREAKKYSFENFQGVSALAFLIKDSTVQKIIINSALSFMRAPIPVKAFTSRAKALAWLEKYK